MKLVVQGIEEIEITDPSGLCNPPAPTLPAAMPGVPPTPTSPVKPGGWGVGMPRKPDYTRNVPGDLNPKWGVGGPMIQQAGQQVDKDKWEKNYSGAEDGSGNNH